MKYQNLSVLACGLTLIALACSHEPSRQVAEVTNGGQAGSEIMRGSPGIRPEEYDPACPDSVENIEAARNVSEALKTLREDIKENLESQDRQQAEHARTVGVVNPQSNRCEDYDQLRNAHDNLVGRVKNLAQGKQETLQRIEQTEALVKLSNSGITGGHILCLDYCFFAQHQQPNVCQQTCKLREDQMKWYLTNQDVEQVGQNCRPYSEEVRKKLQPYYDQSIATARTTAPETVIVLRKYLEDSGKLVQNYESQVQALNMQITQFANPSCAQVYQQKLDRIRDDLRRAHRLGDDGPITGTVFFLGTRDQGYAIPVTALHVSDSERAAQRGDVAQLYLDRRDDKDRLDPLAVDPEALEKTFEEKKKAGQLITFRQGSGLANADKDLSIGDKVRTSATPFPLIGFDASPKLDQKFSIAGFPGNRDLDFTKHDCKFKGYTKVLAHGIMGEPKEGSSYGYVLYCPAAESTVHGMSGAPMLDEQGNVWGVLNAADEQNRNLVIVSPISREATGQLKTGIPSTREGDCVDMSNLKTLGATSRCTIPAG